MPSKFFLRGPKGLGLKCQGISYSSLVLATLATIVMVSVASTSPLAAMLFPGWVFRPGCSGHVPVPVKRPLQPLGSALTLADLPPRPDAACERGDTDKVALYACREAVVKQLAKAACQRLEDNPPNPPFDRVPLQLDHLKSLGHLGAGVKIPRAVDMAVEIDSDVVSDNIRRHGTWEESELQSLLTGLERAAVTQPDGRDPVLLDIGANLGTYSIMAAAFGYPVRAFEAMPRNVAAIHQTLCWNPDLAERVTLFPYALAEEEMSCAVLVTRSNVANGVLACSEEQLRVQGDFEVAGHTHAVRLGDYLGAVRSDVMKMDVEGFEPMVLRSAGSALDHVQTATTEINSDQLPKQSGQLYDEVIGNYLEGWKKHGFEMHICQSKETWTPCMDKAVASIEEITERGKKSIIDVVMQRP